MISTDVLSEGQNLQDAAIIVNYDLPWAIIRLIQRAGRVDRIGQQNENILCYSFLPAEGVDAVEIEAEGTDSLARRLSMPAGVRSVETPGPNRFRIICDRDLRPEAATAVVTAGCRLKQLSLEQPSLETIYTSYFQNSCDEGARNAA